MNLKKMVVTIVLSIFHVTDADKTERTDTQSRDRDADANIALEGQCVVVCDAEPVAVKSSRDDRVRSPAVEQNGIRNLWDNMRYSCGDLASAASRTRNVAFTAVRRTSLSTTERDPILVFDYIQLNIGDGFDSSTGIFTAPVRGVYSFSFQIFRIFNSDTLKIVLKKNTAPVFEGFAGGSAYDFDSAHNQGLILLEADDRVYLQAVDSRMTAGWIKSTFSGYLVFEN